MTEISYIASTLQLGLPKLQVPHFQRNDYAHFTVSPPQATDSFNKVGGSGGPERTKEEGLANANFCVLRLRDTKQPKKSRIAAMGPHPLNEPEPNLRMKPSKTPVLQKIHKKQLFKLPHFAWETLSQQRAQI